MKPNKITSLLLAATAVSLAWASVGTFKSAMGAKNNESEKARPSQKVMEKALHMAAPAPMQAAAQDANGTPYNLRLNSVAEHKVSIAWTSPEPVDGFFEDFEGHSDFAINSPGSIGWTYIDADNKPTYTWQACTFPTQGQKMAYVVMNPWQTVPAVNDNPDYKPHSGQKMLVGFCAVDAQNNDYIISPRLNFDADFQISFWARSYKTGENYNAERIRVGYSTTGTQPSDFTYVNESPYVELPAEWTLVAYNIPKEARYVTINCVSDDAFMLLIDDIFVGTNKVRPESAGMARAAAKNPVVGFNVYRNGEKLNTKLVENVNYDDEVPDYGDYTYTITAVKKDGTETAQSAPLYVNVPDTRMLPFFDDFDDWTLHEDKWTKTQQDGSTESKWSIDYYEYGLIDPSATYSWSTLQNYDQALMTRVLHTPDRTNTYLRFNLKLCNSEQTNVDYLSAEVSSDDGKTWKEIATFDNKNGGFEWTTFQYALADNLSSDLFRVRFRAHGADAKWINYWYVDDVKVWTPVWTSAQLDVKTASAASVADCDVKLTADHGAVINTTTDAAGHVNFDKIEEGVYEVEAKKDGYNVYKGKFEIKNGGSNRINVVITKPTADLSSKEVNADINAESSLVKTLRMTNNGDGELVWHLAAKPAKQSGDDTNRWEKQPSFTASGDLQQSIGFDGEFYYTTSSIELGKFWKYDKDGRFIEQFSIPEMYYKLYDITYDGRYFYGSDWSNRLFQLDFDNRRIVRIITVKDQPDLKITHCSYDPDRKGFWVGTFTTIGFIDKNGKILSRFSNISSSESVSIYGSAYDNVSPGGPYLWLSDMTAETTEQIDKVQIRQFSTAKRVLTDVKHSLTDAPGYVLGSQTTGQNYVCGLFASTDITPGKLTLLGALNQMPNLFFRYTLCETDKWLYFSPRHGKLAPGASQDISVRFDALEDVVGNNHVAEAVLMANPEIGDQTVSFKLNVTGESTCPRPQNVKAEAGDACAVISWQKGNGSAKADSYNVYRNDRKVNASPVTGMTFTDKQLVYGEYIYKVTAVYGGKESAKSDSVKVLVKNGAQYYPPVGVAASINGNKNVSLSWQSPLYGMDKPSIMTWATGKHADNIGMTYGGIFYAGVKWDAYDIAAYRGRRIASVAVQLVNPVQYIALIIKKDGENIYKKQYKGDFKFDGTLTAIPVDEDIRLVPGHEYLFCFEIKSDAGVQPLGIDDGKAVLDKGDLLSTDGEKWFSAAISGIGGNFNINVNLDPADTTEEKPLGYNVYRNGVKVNSKLITSQSYNDVLSSTGIFSYTLTSVYANNGESAASKPVDVEAYEIKDKTAPHTVNADVERNRTISLRWDNPTKEPQVIKADVAKRPVTTVEGYPEYVRSFFGPKSGMAVVTDGTYVYTSVYNEDGRIEKYDFDGNKLGSYSVDGIKGVRNMAYDGEWLYVADNTTNIHRIDPATMENKEDIAISEYSRHLAYVPSLDGGKGGFEVGDWQTSIYVTKNGGKIGTGPILKGASGTAYHNGKLYAFEQGNDANKYTIGIYDDENERVGSIDLGKYVEIDDIASVSAGGMSSFTGKDGITYLLLSLQRQGEPVQFVVLDLGGLTTVAGYNVYRNGEKRNAEMLTHRYFEETETKENEYDYAVQTVYINGETSDLSAVSTVEIVSTGTAKTPVNTTAKQSSYGYNVLLTFADPDMYQNAASKENFESAGVGEEVYRVGGESYKSGWTVSDDEAFDGSKSITADAQSSAFGVIPAEGMSYLRLAARNADDHNGEGTLNVYYSTSGTNRANFIFLQSWKTSESWQDLQCELPAGTEYVALSKDAAQPKQYVDGVALYSSTPKSNLYGFNIYRNGEKITANPVSGVSYVDRNLLAGKYSYEFELVTKTSAVSEKSAPVSIDLYYDNGSLAPTNLRVSQKAEGNRLSWQFPALGEPVYLRWHDGFNYKAGGLTNGGAFFAGACWFASDLKGYGNLALSDVEVYINQIPEALFLLVYENNTLVRQQFVPSLKQYSFNTIHLEEPLKIDEGKNLRVAVYIEQNEITVPLGYDRGPARSGRGDLYSADGITWQTMEASGSEVDANWNISIGLSPYSNVLPGTENKAAKKLPAFQPKRKANADISFKAVDAKGEPSSDKNVFEGYNVYRNGDRLNNELTTDTVFTDATTLSDKYLTYQVSAVYSVAGEKFSDKVTIIATGIDGVNGQNGVTLKVEDGQLVVLGAHNGDRITVVSADGKLIASDIATDEYRHTVSLASATTGTYVVKVGNATFKLNIKRK